jgi:hypothetical protein
LSAGLNLQSLALARKSFISMAYIVGPKGEHPGLYTDRAGSAISNHGFGEFFALMPRNWHTILRPFANREDMLCPGQTRLR